MNEAKSNEQINAEIQQSKADFLRASDIMPPYKKGKNQAVKQQEASEKTTQPTDSAQETPAQQAASSQDNITKAQNKAEDTGERQAEIPKFDLAEEIMAEQRKITAIKRKGPGKKIEAQGQERHVEPAGYAIEPPRSASPEQEKIISEIVARDIEKLLRGDILSSQT
ncbi:MAG: hypothetical protein ACYS0I_13290 [Planctomycetota bacterium]